MINRKLIIILILLFIVPNCGYCKSKKAHIAKPKIMVNSRGTKDRSKRGLKRPKTLFDVVSDRVIKLNASAYTLSKNETDGDPFVTSTGERPIAGKTCAVSRDLKHLINKRIYLVSEKKVLYVNDTMNARYRKSIDIVMKTKKKAFKFGRKDMMVVVLD